MTRRADFDRDGFMVVEQFFDLGMLEHLEEIVCDIIRAKAPGSYLYLSELDDGISILEAIGHERVAEVYDTIAHSTAFMSLVSDARLSSTVNYFLRRQPFAPLYTFTPRCRIDPPRDDRRTYGWHQEVFYSLPKSNFLQTWAPLFRDSTLENGTIQVLVGSHVEGIAPQSWTEGEGRALQVIVDQSTVAKYEASAIEMRVGDLMIFSNRLIHRSGVNTSKHVRYSMVGMYHDIDSVDFKPADLRFNYRGQTPREWFDEIQKGQNV